MTKVDERSFIFCFGYYCVIEVGFMKRIKIRYFDMDTLDHYLYRIIIYNDRKEMILNEVTKQDFFIFDIPYYGIYQIIVVPCANLVCNSACRKVFIHKNFEQTLSLCFSFYKPSKSKKTVTLILTVQNYKWLPISGVQITL